MANKLLQGYIVVYNNGLMSSDLEDILHPDYNSAKEEVEIYFKNTVVADIEETEIMSVTLVANTKCKLEKVKDE